MAGIGVKNGVRYLMTAGHCLRTIGSNYYQYYSKVGVQHTNAMSYAVPYDLGLIRITDSSLRASNGTIVKRRASNKLYLNDENNNNYTGSIIGTRYPVLGDIVSKSGVKTGITSGRINSLNHKVEYTGYRPIYCVRVEAYGSTSVYSDGGDSGAPTYVNGVDWNTKYFVGIHSGGRGNKIGYFTPIYRLYDAFGSNFRVYTSGLEVILD